MKRVCHDGIDDDFLFVFLRYYNLSLDILNLYKRGNQNFIGNQDLIVFLEFQYDHFKQSHLELEKYFDREIVKVTRKGVSDECFLAKTKLENIPIFIIRDSSYTKLLHGEPKIYSRKPVQMPLEKLCQFLNLEPPLTFEECPRNVDMYKVDQNIVFSDYETPGTSDNAIMIGFDGENHYWIPTRNIIKKRFFCTKFPGQCGVFFYKQHQQLEHEAICRTEPKIISEQVCYMYIALIQNKNFRCVTEWKMISLNLQSVSDIYRRVSKITDILISLRGILKPWKPKGQLLKILLSKLCKIS